MEAAGAGGSSSSSRVDRSVTEKHRRMKMRDLYARLASLLPPNPSKERLPLPALLDEATAHVVQLKERVNALKAKKKELEEKNNTVIVPAIQIKDNGSTLDVHLITSLNKGFMLNKVLTILEEEGAGVISVSYSTTTDKIFYTIYSQAFCPRLGIEASRIYERLKNLVDFY